MVVGYANSVRGGRISIFANTLLSYKQDIDEKKVKGLYIDISPMIDNENTARDLKILVEYIDLLCKRLHIGVAIGGYSLKIYKILKTYTSQTPILLFKNFHVAKLFFNPKTFKKELRILIFDEDKKNVDDIAKELAKTGYSALRATSKEDFQKQVQIGNADIIITQTSLNEGASSKKAKKLTISKKLIQNLPVLMDSSVETLVMLTGLKASKSTHGIKRFMSKLPADTLVTMMSFKGDIDGNFILMFPKKIAVIALESMIGEKIDNENVPEIIDGVKELCNIITGSAKTALQEKSVNVMFDLPKAYTSPQTVSSILGDNNGVWIDMSLEGKAFYMFITS